MNKILSLSLSVLSSLLFFSCGKNMSSDFPLPVSRQEAVYMATNNQNIISYNPYTGSKNWEVHLKGNSKGVPVICSKRLYAITDNGYLYCIDIFTGTIAREMNIGKPSILSMAVNNSQLIVAADNLYEYDTTGTLIWTYNAGQNCSSSPQVANGHVYVGVNDMIHAVDASSGTGIWTSPSAGGVTILSSPRVSNGLVYYGGQDKKIYAINESNGSLKWQYATGDKITSSPMVYGGMCIIGSADYAVYCIDTTSPSSPPNGELRWKLPTLDRVNSSPTVHAASNTVLIGGYDFNLYAIDHVSGMLKWKYPAGSIINSSPVVYKDYVYFNAMDHYLYCVDARNGAIVWKAFLNGSSDSSPMVDDLKNGQYPGISGMSTY